MIDNNRYIVQETTGYKSTQEAYCRIQTEYSSLRGVSVCLDKEDGLWYIVQVKSVMQRERQGERCSPYLVFRIIINLNTTANEFVHFL